MNVLAGTADLVRLILRRDRIGLIIWIALAAATPIGVASSFKVLYPTAEALRAYAAQVMTTPASVGMLGHVYSATLGGLVAWRTGLNSTILLAPVSLLLVIRYTRAEEEAGRSELIGSTAVGRLAPLVAALAVVLAANLVVAVLEAGGLIVLGLPAAGSIALGLSAASAGWIFAAVGGLAAQMSESPSGARGIALGTFGLTYLARAIGDAGPTGLSWISPLAWVRFTRAFAGERWWVFLLLAALVAVLAVEGLRLALRRDLGSGTLPQRPIPAEAAPGPGSPLALAWRLRRSELLAWAAGSALFGLLLGAVGPSISRFTNTPQLKEWASRSGARNSGDIYLFVLMYVLGQVASAYAIAVTLRMRVEEVDGRADPLLATPVTRLSWAGSHLFVAMIGPAILLAALGLAMGLVYGLIAGDVTHNLPRLLARTMVTLPAIWVMVGLTATLFGLLPRLAIAGSWALLGAFLLLELAWELRRISPAVFGVSPFAHVHWAVQIMPASILWLTAVAAGLIAVGLLGFQRRDIG